MLFASADFLLFIVPVLLCYWLLRGRGKSGLWLLLAASYFFYAAGPAPATGELPPAWYFVGLLVGSTLVDYICALRIAASASRGVRAAWLATSLLANLGLLAYFKYTGFCLDVARAVAEGLALHAAIPTFEAVLPIGISFYTFQSLSYTIDVWRGRLAAERSLLRFAVYVAFFPQLVAGPIVRATEFLPQLRAPSRVGVEQVNEAVFRIAKGVVKKVLLGDFIAASFADLVFASPADYSSLENLLALYAFTLQIYADFSGYSDIAIGVALLMGYRLPENFARPYQAGSVGEFWRRWHMTLSTWLRDYLFFPLGGSRRGRGRNYFNLWLTMFLVGLWHGASWNFLVYANLQAFAMVLSRALRDLRQLRGRALALVVAAAVVALGTSALVFGALGLPWSVGWKWVALACAGAALTALLPLDSVGAWSRPLHVVLTFHFCVLSRIFFRAPDLEHATAMVTQLASWDGLGIRPGLLSLPSWVEAARALQSSPALRAGLAWTGDWGLGLLLAFGLLIHFTPSSLPERWGRRLVAALPAPVLGLALSVLVWMLSDLLSGPRANIYFAF